MIKINPFIDLTLDEFLDNVEELKGKLENFQVFHILKERLEESIKLYDKKDKFVEKEKIRDNILKRYEILNNFFKSIGEYGLWLDRDGMEVPFENIERTMGIIYDDVSDIIMECSELKKSKPVDIYININTS